MVGLRDAKGSVIGTPKIRFMIMTRKIYKCATPFIGSRTLIS